MSSSRGPPSSAGHNGDERGADGSDDGLFVSNNNNHGDFGEGDPEPRLPDGNNDEDDNEGVEGEENQEPDAEDDNSSEVDPEVLDELSDSEEESGLKQKQKQKPRPRPRPRRRNPNPRPRRCQNCAVITQQWHDEVTRITAEFRETELRLRAEIRRLKEEIERLNGLLERGRIHWDPWGPRLAEFLEQIRSRGPNLADDDDDLYSEIYHDSCKQGNMSTDIDVIHPDLYLDKTPYSRDDIRDHFQAQWLHDRYSGAFGDLRDNEPFKFESLPIEIQCRIWKLLIPNGQLIHCLSRLDPWNPPLDCMEGIVHFPSRFHIGDTPCSIAKADKPSRFLKFLQVSKRWHYATAHLFYATNTFAFSSLGEFGRFCNGIKKARVERLVHVELMWRGALTPRQNKGVSLRKQPLAWFMYTSRLRTLVVHINESARFYMRRPYEMMHPSDYDKDFAGDEYKEDDLDIFGMEVRRTDSQPNYRKNRSLRTTQGMDFIYQLRGMKWVRFYDADAPNARRIIRDESFLQDVNNVAQRKKTDAMALKTEIENLPALTGLDDFIPDDELNELVKGFYDEIPVENVSMGGSETSLNSSGISGLSTFSSDSDPDDDSGDSSRSPSGTSRGSHELEIDRVVEVVDSDTEMEDDDRPSDRPNYNGSQPTYIDLSDSTSDSGGSSRSSSNGNDGYPYESGLHTTVTPQPRVIVIEDDDNDDRKRRHRRRGGGFSTDSGGLFMPSGSCTATADNDLSSDNEMAVELIDLTLEDSDADADGSGGSVAGRSLKRSGSDDGPG
ncbi:hypothetical protein F4782DRAFT_20832 [Xylaria castorea]|nr:hypothetical protein F4782DRAFT_20832 [Xylaria castorea]